MRKSVDEVKYLKACINNLVGILALSATWTGGDAHQIVSALLDSICGMLRLDFVYAKLESTAGSAPIEMSRPAQSGNWAGQPAVINEVLKASLRFKMPTWPLVVQKSTEEGDVSIAAFRIGGLNDEIGVLVVGSRRTDFPDASEKLLLNAAVNQASIGLQEARLTGEQSRLANELNQKVAQRTRELDRFFNISLDLLCIVDQHGYFRRLNQAWEKTLGYIRSELLARPLIDFVHPEDMTKTRAACADVIAGRNVVDFSNRFRCKDGSYRWLEWYAASGDRILYATARDITERKRTEADLHKALDEIKELKDQLYKENIALREEIDQASMFEEIVGASPPLKAVLERVAKVAPTDATVFITGETGTGKELVARSIHKRSQRSSRAFVTVNCAAVPASLIASELFGHEEGAFTGAHKRRLGRFELAEGGTILLDEIGELPTETQIALLRVLQEHEFERVGGNQTIRTNVRVISATSRDLKAAIEAGTFRRDLFYRINVFPIEMPPLRERKEDIHMLAEYFIHRYASKMGKRIQGINKKILDLFQSYPWPGNIRELQNVIERSVILCETKNFSVDDSWLVGEYRQSQSAGQPFSDKRLNCEKEIIESALAGSRGRVAGPMGAAARLGIPPTTLESKIRSLKINKHRFKPT